MRYQSLKLNLIFLFFFFLQNGFKQRKNSELFLKKSPRKLNKSLQALSVKTAKPNLLRYGSVNSQRDHPPPPPGHLSGICHFVLEKLQMPHGGAQKYSANSPPLDNTN